MVRDYLPAILIASLNTWQRYNTMKRYNVQTGFPFQVELPSVIPLTVTAHARRASQSDRYGQIVITQTLNTANAQLVEFETDDHGHITKIVLRKSYSPSLDAVYVVVKGGVLVTVWLNEKTDNHVTLQRNRISA